ncbi:MAG TPA: M36 family metallopeptidase [Blastocatellia bacterium]|nr:M36 family metallopeptidase [Blastocatellia bacterium]
MKKRVFFAVFIALTFLALTSVVPRLSRRTLAQDEFWHSGAPDFDIRSERSEVSANVLKRSRQKLTASQKEKKRVLLRNVKSATDRLSQSTAGIAVLVPEESTVPEIVGVVGGDRTLTPPSTRKHERIVRDFLTQNVDLYGLTPKQISRLKKAADYTNPSGNLSWVTFRQEINGLPVFQGELSAALKPSGELVRTVSRLLPGLDDTAVAPGIRTASAGTNASGAISAAQAVARAAETIGVSVDPDSLLVKESSPDGRTFVFEPGPFADEIKVELQYFPLEPGVVELAWSMVLWEDNPAYYSIVDAEGGELLWRKNITDEQTQTATYSIYNDDSPTPLSPSNAVPGSGIQGAPISRTLFTLISELPAFDNLGWITDGGNTTTGNNVDAGLDIVAPNGIDPTGRPSGNPFRVFDFSYNPAPGIPAPGDAPIGADYRNGIVTNLFFWTNRYHDLVYQLGFTEAARNFQQNNFGRGGLGNDFVRAEAQDFSGTNNANFSTPPDGSLPRMQMFIFTGPTPQRDGDIDADVFLHELTHGLSNRLHNNASGLGVTQAGGMGEGWSDFYARALRSSADEDVDGVYAAGAYVTLNIRAGFTDNYYYGIRRFPYAVKTNVGANGKPHNPLTYADIDPAQINLTDGAFPRGPIGSANAAEVHNIGEVWCMMLLEVRARLIHRLGWAAGNQRALQIVTDGMKLDPVNPTLINARDSILAADCAGFGGEDELDIWDGFATRGLGASAKGSVGTTAVTEAFDLPNLKLGTISFADGCSNSGFADPGELLTLSVPLSNPFCANSITGVTASVVGGGSADYGTISGGSSVTRTIPFHVPSDTPCGSVLTLTINIDGSRGPTTRTITIFVGKPVTTATENFDGVTAPALPAGWTGTVPTGLATNNWRTSVSQFQTSPNSMFVPDPSTRTEARLVSPAFTITSGAAQVSFKNNFSLEQGFDGGVLELSTDGGVTFADIVAAGGIFLSGGYTGALATGGGSAPTINGRNAWTGTSGGFITTTAILPASAAGHDVMFRFIMGSDSSVGSSGWFIDDLTVSGMTECHPDLAPVISCPANIVHGTDPGQCSAVVTFAVTGTDDCPEVTLVTSPASGSTFPKGVTTVTSTATDSSGNQSSCTFTVTVNDTQAPAITCPANITAVTAAPNVFSTVVSFTTPTPTDNCPGVGVACTPATGSAFPVGITTVTCTATDTSGNATACKFTVTVFDVCLQDGATSTVLLVNSLTGDYRFCCGGTIYSGRGSVAKSGAVITLTVSTGSQRVTARVDSAAKSGSASLQSPPGTMRCSITDTNIMNNTCRCQ